MDSKSCGRRSLPASNTVMVWVRRLMMPPKRLPWPTGQVIAMRPEHDALAVEVSVPDDADLARFAEVVKVHLERFGQRDELTVVWDSLS